MLARLHYLILTTMQEEKEIADEKMYEQGVKIRRLLEENKELKKESSNPATTPAKKKKGGEVDSHKEESSGDDINLKEGGGDSSSDDDDDSSIESEEPTPRAENLTPSQRYYIYWLMPLLILCPGLIRSLRKTTPHWKSCSLKKICTRSLHHVMVLVTAF